MLDTMRRFHRFVLLILSLLFPADGIYPEDVDWHRRPRLSLPIVLDGPKIDGLVGKDEWLSAAQLGPLKVGRDGVADEHRRDVFIGFDNKNLYIAFQFHRPDGAVKPALPGKTGHLDSTQGGDFIEIMFAPKLEYDKGYTFWLFPNGAFAEASLGREKNMSWNTEWQQAARVTDFGWEGEIAIPFKTFDRELPPLPKEEWGFDVVDNRMTPSRLLAHWSYRGKLWHKYENFGRIRFGRNIPAVRFQNAGKLGKNLSVEFDVINITYVPKKIRSELNLYKRKSGSAGDSKSYYESIEVGSNQKGQPELTEEQKLESMVLSAMKSYRNLTLQKSQGVNLPSFERRAIGFSRAAVKGEYLISYQIWDGKKTLAQGITTFRIQPPPAPKPEP